MTYLFCLNHGKCCNTCSDNMNTIRTFYEPEDEVVVYNHNPKPPKVAKRNYEIELLEAEQAKWLTREVSICEWYTETDERIPWTDNTNKPIGQTQ